MNEPFIAKFQDRTSPPVHQTDHGPCVLLGHFNVMAGERNRAFDEIGELRNDIQSRISRDYAIENLARSVMESIEKGRIGFAAGIGEFNSLLQRKRREWLDIDRRVIADKLAEAFDYEAESLVYEDDSGWEITGAIYAKPVYVRHAADAESTDTHQRQFVVVFDEDATTVESSGVH